MLLVERCDLAILKTIIIIIIIIIITMCAPASVGRAEAGRRRRRVAVPAEPRRRGTDAVRLHPPAGGRDAHAVRPTAATRQDRPCRDDLLRHATVSAQFHPRPQQTGQLVLWHLFRADAPVGAPEMLLRDFLRQHAVPQRDSDFDVGHATRGPSIKGIFDSRSLIRIHSESRFGFTSQIECPFSSKQATVT